MVLLEKDELRFAAQVEKFSGEALIARTVLLSLGRTRHAVNIGFEDLSAEKVRDYQIKL